MGRAHSRLLADIEEDLNTLNRSVSNVSVYEIWKFPEFEKKLQQINSKFRNLSTHLNYVDEQTRDEIREENNVTLHNILYYQNAISKKLEEKAWLRELLLRYRRFLRLIWPILVWFGLPNIPLLGDGEEDDW